jgi:hypothetical protein
MSFFRTLAIAFAALAPLSLLAQAPASKPAEEVYKNIQQMKGTPADQLPAAMQFIAASLGVDCAFCHNTEKFEADDKRAKATARQMMAMTAQINKDSFNGRQQITCESCHRGSNRPVNTPPVLESDAPASANSLGGGPSGPGGGRGQQPAAPTADQIVDSYIAALGGADALRKVTTRVESGVLIANGSETPIDIYAKAPNFRVSVSHPKSGDSFTAFDGTAGWMGSTGRAARSMTATESLASGLDAEFHLGLRIKELFPQIRVGRAEEINGAQQYVLTATRPGQSNVRFDFDQKTGLLTRETRYADTPMGRNATQIDFADYRNVEGVKIPFRWTLARPIARFTIQIKEAKVNVPVDDAKFAKPAGEIK